MRTFGVRLLVLVLIWMMTPGLNEAVENAWHLAWAGHSAHSLEAGPDHQPSDEEHGCSGTFHLCSCHHSPPMTLPLAASTRALHAADHEPPRLESSWKSPVLPGPFRPPRS